MSGVRIGDLAYGLRQLRRAPDLTAMRAAESPDRLARLALVPAARNLGIAIGLLPAHLRDEATAALLACRVLDAYEDLMDPQLAGNAVLLAANYLRATTGTPPPPLRAVTLRDSEAVDLILATRIRDVRAMVSALPCEGQQRVGRLLVDIGQVMARNIDSPLPRATYSEGVLGRVALYACSLLTEGACTGADLGELAGCIGIAAQLANDLRDGELALYGAGDHAELRRAVLLQLLVPALGGFALLAHVGPRIPSRGARTAMAYLTITTTAFLCASVGAPAPYRRSLRLAAVVLAARSPVRWAAMLARVRHCADAAIHRLLDASPELSTGPDRAADVLRLGDRSVRSLAIGPLTVDLAFALVDALPEEPLTAELPGNQKRRMMIADHLAFGALERLRPNDTDAMFALAAQFQLTALDVANQGEHR
ncbi:hypothetical protein [Mycobacterium gastri]|uniref:Uncharacterized protein n=1 Tax=Mycobacterium gastri TaxID=1777 RepID=A0A1X1VXJ2_MYCGS|nr:hypothetical protein [Mycobacterium gastri]ETW21675.1 hypothetical protein MGAST_24560 [Mycobacterium gastri 'Wayne']ORV74630.1 hypothetical protein AWC07_24980 [Mycobacterium gastri]